MNVKGKIVYISGPMSGIHEYNKPDFYNAELDIDRLGAKIVISPARHPVGLTHEQYMQYAMLDIDNADMIVLLPGWENSKGARQEVNRAEIMGKPVQRFNP